MGITIRIHSFISSQPKVRKTHGFSGLDSMFNETWGLGFWGNSELCNFKSNTLSLNGIRGRDPRFKDSTLSARRFRIQGLGLRGADSVHKKTYWSLVGKAGMF